MALTVIVIDSADSSLSSKKLDRKSKGTEEDLNKTKPEHNEVERRARMHDDG